MRRAAKVDGNHAAIVRALRAAGCGVQSIATVGKGVPDLLVCHWSLPRGLAMLIEVKNGSLPPSAQRLTPDELEWHQRWESRHGRVEIARDVQEALALIGAKLP